MTKWVKFTHKYPSDEQQDAMAGNIIVWVEETQSAEIRGWWYPDKYPKDKYYKDGLKEIIKGKYKYWLEIPIPASPIDD